MRDINSLNEEQTVQITEDEQKIYIKDNLIMKKTVISDYVSFILSSVNELMNIEDRTNENASLECLNLIKTKVKNSLLALQNEKSYNKEQIKKILPELIIVNRYKLNTEIDSGLLFCDECKRWYPVKESIPQLLPDKYRDKESDLQFLKTNKNLLDDKFFLQNLKPYNI